MFPGLLANILGFGVRRKCFSLPRTQVPSIQEHPDSILVLQTQILWVSIRVSQGPDNWKGTCLPQSEEVGFRKSEVTHAAWTAFLEWERNVGQAVHSYPQHNPLVEVG